MPCPSDDDDVNLSMDFKEICSKYHVCLSVVERSQLSPIIHRGCDSTCRKKTYFTFRVRIRGTSWLEGWRAASQFIIVIARRRIESTIQIGLIFDPIVSPGKRFSTQFTFTSAHGDAEVLIILVQIVWFIITHWIICILLSWFASFHSNVFRKFRDIS